MSDAQTNKLAGWCCAVAATLSAIALLGWACEIDHLTSVVPGLVAMNPLTATSFLWAAAGLWLILLPETRLYQRLAFFCGVVVFLIGATKSCDYLFHTEWNFDRLLFASSLARNRMAPNTAFSFVFLGLALLTIDQWSTRRYWPAQIFALIVATIAFLSLLGYGYGAAPMYQVKSFVAMALNTAVAFAMLSVGILLARPECGLTSVMLYRGPGGMMARKLLPAAVTIPYSLGWLGVLGYRAGLFDTAFGTALIVAMTTIVLVLLICRIAAELNEADCERRLANEALRKTSVEIHDLYNRAPCGYHSLNGEGVFVAINDTELQWLGYSRGEVIGTRRFSDLLTPTSQRLFADNFHRFKERGDIHDLEFELIRKDGSIFPVLLSATAIFDDHGNYVANRSTIFDCTERRRLETAARHIKDIESDVQNVVDGMRRGISNLQRTGMELNEVSRTMHELLKGSGIASNHQRLGQQLLDEDLDRCIKVLRTTAGQLAHAVDCVGGRSHESAEDSHNYACAKAGVFEREAAAAIAPTSGFDLPESAGFGSLPALVN